MPLRPLPEPKSIELDLGSGYKMSFYACNSYPLMTIHNYDKKEFNPIGADIPRKEFAKLKEWFKSLD